MFYDLNVRAEKIKETISFAKSLGWQGIGIILEYKKLGEISKIRKSLNREGIDMCFGVEISPKKISSVKKEVLKARKHVELVVVNGGDLDVNRKAVEIPEVDILIHPWGPLNDLRSDAGINHIVAKIARENNVSICFDFRGMLHSYQRTRSELFKNLFRAARIIKKYKAPFVISSGAVSYWDLRAPSELISFGRLLGFGDKEIKKSMSESIVKENRKRLGEKWIMPGVEIE